MTNEQFSAVLATMPVKQDEDGWWKTDRDQFLGLYAAHEGVALTIAKIESVKVEGQFVRARTHRGELYVIAVDDLFALAAEAPALGARKAGFAND